MLTRYAVGNDLHCGSEQGEHVSRDDGKRGNEHLEAETEGVECGRDVRRHAESDEDGEEFPEVAGRPEHGLDEPTNVAIRISVFPCRH